MKKLILALAATVAFGGTAFAADLSARTNYTKAPAMPSYQSWTGFYIFGGAGGGVWDADTFISSTPANQALTVNQRQGGDGWFGTVGAGYDWQFNSSWVGGIFADGQFGSIKGSLSDPTLAGSGSIKMQDAWAAGARFGYLVAPNVFSYVNAGYTGSHWSGSTLVNLVGNPTGFHTNSFNNNGWFVGGGVENNFNIFGITAPGWFMKTEYRAAYYDRKGATEFTDVGNVNSGFVANFKPMVQTVSTSLVYRFNWSGPIVAKY
jgi:outer membrane immunogenic protein